jgi:GGDEF domain-containing protein
MIFWNPEVFFSNFTQNLKKLNFNCSKMSDQWCISIWLWPNCTKRARIKWNERYILELSARLTLVGAPGSFSNLVSYLMTRRALETRSMTINLYSERENPFSAANLANLNDQLLNQLHMWSLCDPLTHLMNGKMLIERSTKRCLSSKRRLSES